MRAPLEVLLVSASPIVSAAMQYWLESGSDRFRCRILEAENASTAAISSRNAVVLVICRHWREMARWSCGLRRPFAGHPWLLLADLRLAGMFGPLLENRLCTLIAPDWPPDELPLALEVLARRRALCAPEELREQFCRAAFPVAQGGAVDLTPKELQCGCAISLGLTNTQIAETLYLSEGTVKNRVSQLMGKLQARNREAVAVYFERIIALLSRTLGHGNVMEHGMAGPYHVTGERRHRPA